MHLSKLIVLSIFVLGIHARAAAPNIVVIMSDDMGFSDLGCYGGEIQTPNLDSLAAGGLRLTQFYNMARCCPTRASLLTGLYPHQAGMGHMTANGKAGNPAYAGDLSRNSLTIAEMLRPAGYATYMAGKWHVARVTAPQGPRDNWPVARGFDRFYGTITGGGSFYDPTTLCRQEQYITPDNDPPYKPRTFYYTDAITDNAISFLKDHQQGGSKPFFLYVAYTAAHWPMHALPEDIAKYKGKYDGGYAPIRAARLKRAREMGLIDPKWEMTPGAEDWDAVKDKAWEAACMEVYAAMVDRMDQGIGKLVAELKRQNQLDNTLILFLQDNGGCAENMGRQSNADKIKDAAYKPFGPDDLQPHIWPPMQTRDGRAVRTGPGVMPGGPDTYIAYGRGWANVSNTPFREYKHWVHEGGISTPLIAHWPAGIASERRGKLESSPAHLIDIAATCVDLAGVKYPAERPALEGVTLRPVFEGKALQRQNPIFWEHEGNRALRDGKWKLVAKGPTGPWELYDMDADRTETHDLAAQQTARVNAMVGQWESWARRTQVVPWIWKPAYGAKESAGAQNRFELQAGADLAKEEAPQIAEQAFKVTVELETPAGDGVLVAQGGAAHGWAMYMKDGTLHWVTRRANKSEEATAPVGQARSLSATLSRDGTVTLQADGREVAKKKVGLVKQMPLDGLQVGSDQAGAVGDYTAPFAYKGKVKRVLIQVEDK